MEGVGLDRFPSSGWARWLTRAAAPQAATTNYYRSIWISDLHLGTRRCRARNCCEFLEQHEADNLYLVGDIVDGWVMGPTWHWSREQGAVVEKITAWHRLGVRVTFSARQP